MCIVRSELTCPRRKLRQVILALRRSRHRLPQQMLGQIRVPNAICKVAPAVGFSQPSLLTDAPERLEAIGSHGQLFGGVFLQQNEPVPLFVQFEGNVGAELAQVIFGAAPDQAAWHGEKEAPSQVPFLVDPGSLAEDRGIGLELSTWDRGYVELALVLFILFPGKEGGFYLSKLSAVADEEPTGRVTCASRGNDQERSPIQGPHLPCLPRPVFRIVLYDAQGVNPQITDPEAPGEEDRLAKGLGELVKGDFIAMLRQICVDGAKWTLVYRAPAMTQSTVCALCSIRFEEPHCCSGGLWPVADLKNARGEFCIAAAEVAPAMVMIVHAVL